MSKIGWYSIFIACSLCASDTLYQTQHPVLKSIGVALVDAASTLYQLMTCTYHPPLPHRVMQHEPSSQDETLQWCGHATLLIQTASITILTDPVFGDIPGHTRYTDLGVDPKKLPPIDIILISHDHYDHCDIPTLAFLRDRQTPEPHIICPDGIASFLKRNGHTRITSTQWWDNVRITPGCRITCVPAHHWSGRHPCSINASLWAGWLIQGAYTYYFAGDTACNLQLFREIRSKARHIHVTALPVGPETPYCCTHDAHLQANQASQAATTLDSYIVPIHYATFRLGPDHPDRPAYRLSHLIQRLPLLAHRLKLLKMGETYTPAQMHPCRRGSYITDARYPLSPQQYE